MRLHKFLDVKTIDPDMVHNVLSRLYLEFPLHNNTMILLNILILEFYIHPAREQSAWASKDPPL
jgi:hypothetical protein